MSAHVRFYISTLNSSIGNLTFLASIVAFLLAEGHSLVEVGVLMGTSRLVPIVTNYLFGDLSDRLGPKPVLVGAELGVIVAMLGLLYVWHEQHTEFYLLFFLVVVRSLFQSMQAPGRAKVAKLFSKEDADSNLLHAVFLNIATHGAAFFSGLIAWVAIRYGSFTAVVLFDVATSLIAILAISSIKEISLPAAPAGSPTVKLFAKFRNAFQYAKLPFVLDLLLALSMCGLHTFNARVAGSSFDRIALLVSCYGLAVWTSGYAAKKLSHILSDAVAWLALGATFIGVVTLNESLVLTLMLVFARDFFYWLNFHRLTAAIQHRCPQEYVGGVFAARMMMMVTVLALGEYLVAGISEILPLIFEGIWRATLCVLVCVVMIATTKKTRFL